MNPKDCVFCAIAADREPASIVLNERDVLAFMSLEQPNPYKVLVSPRAHVETIYDLTDDLAASIMQATVCVARAIRAVSACPGLNLIQANGVAGQQDIFHFHLHLLPRYPDDAVRNFFWDATVVARSQLDSLAADIRRHLSLI